MKSLHILLHGFTRPYSLYRVRAPFWRPLLVTAVLASSDFGQGQYSGGFFKNGEICPGVAGLSPGQHLLLLGVLMNFDSP
jgi:hypothetical protein